MFQEISHISYLISYNLISIVASYTTIKIEKLLSVQGQINQERKCGAYIHWNVIESLNMKAILSFEAKWEAIGKGEIS